MIIFRNVEFRILDKFNLIRYAFFKNFVIINIIITLNLYLSFIMIEIMKLAKRVSQEKIPRDHFSLYKNKLILYKIKNISYLMLK